MGRREIKALEVKRGDVGFSNSQLGFQWSLQDGNFHPGGLFAGVGQVGGMGFGASSPNPQDDNDGAGGTGSGVKLPYTDLYVKYVSAPEGFKEVVSVPEATVEEEGGLKKKKKKGGVRFKVKVANPSLIYM